MSDVHDTRELAVRDEEDPDAGSTWTWFLAGSVIFVALVIGVAALYYDMASKRIDEVQTSVPLSSVERLDAEQQARLEGFRQELRADSPEGAIVIPVERAMELVIEDLNDGA